MLTAKLPAQMTHKDRTESEHIEPSDESDASKSEVQTVSGHRFAIGNQVSKGKGRPSGKRRSLADLVRRETKGLKRQVQVMVAISVNMDGKTNKRDQIEACKWLADRGYGKSVDTTVQIAAEAQHAVDAVEVSNDQLRSLALTLRIMPPTGVSKGVEASDEAAKPAQAKAG